MRRSIEQLMSYRKKCLVQSNVFVTFFLPAAFKKLVIIFVLLFLCTYISFLKIIESGKNKCANQINFCYKVFKSLLISVGVYRHALYELSYLRK